MHNNTKGFSAVALVVALAAVIAGGIVYYTATSKPSEDAMMAENEMMPARDGSASGGEDVMEGDEMLTEEVMMQDNAAPQGVPEPLALSGTVLAGTDAPLIDFNQPDYEKAVADGRLVVLYFYANWCPVCAEETKNSLYPAFDAMAGMPVVGFRVNYNDNETDDAERELAREFGVAYQHTKVFVKGGKRILKSPESWDHERYENEIAKAL